MASRNIHDTHTQNIHHSDHALHSSEEADLGPYGVDPSEGNAAAVENGSSSFEATLLRYYGLREQPFGVTPDTRFLYLTEKYRDALATLWYGIEAGRGFLTLTAEPGMGKTTLFFALLERYRSSARTAFLFQTQCNWREFLAYVLADLGIECNSQDAVRMHKQLYDALVAEARAGRRFVLFIDEAHDLDPSVLETVRLLSDFETQRAKLMQIVLAGHPSLADRLADPALRQRISVRTRLYPLAPPEVIGYVDHRLRAAGYGGRPLFTQDALALVAARTEGIPRNINNVCFHALTAGMALDRKTIDPGIIEGVLTDLEMNSPGAQRQEPPSPAFLGLAAARHNDEVMQEFFATSHDSRPSGTIKQPSKSAVGAEKPASHPLAPEGGPVQSLAGTDLQPESSHVRIKLPPISVFPAQSSESPGQGRLRQRNARPVEKQESVRRRPELTFGSVASEPRAKTWRAPIFVALLLACGIGVYLYRSAQSERPGGESALPVTPGNSPNQHASQAPPAAPAPVPTTGALSSSNPMRDTKAASASNSSSRSTDTKAANTAKPSGQLSSASAQPEEEIPSGHQKAAVKTGTHARKRAIERQSEPASRDRGDLTVTSNVRGAQISLDGRTDPAWRTPYTFHSLPARLYLVVISKNGYVKSMESIQVNAGSRASHDAQLEVASGEISIVTQPPSLPVFVDGKPYGASPVRAELAAGEHTYSVVPPPGKAPLSKSFVIQSGDLLKHTVSW